MRFDRRTRHIVHLKDEHIYRVSYTPITESARMEKLRPADRLLVGIASAVDYWDNVSQRTDSLACARTVQAAWNAGDRFLLDSDSARRAAEIVADLADTRPDENDISSALNDLSNAIAQTRLANLLPEELDVLPILEQAASDCMDLPEYTSWTTYSQRRKFFFSIPRKGKTSVVYTLMNLYFGFGMTPLLTSRQRAELADLPRGTGRDGALTFFRQALDALRKYKSDLA